MTIDPDLELIRDQGAIGNRHSQWKQKNNIGVNVPFCMRFHKHRITVYFIAAQHTIDPKSSTYTLIKKVLSKRDINMVALEGSHYSYGIIIKSRDRNTEGDYAIKIAKENKIPIIGIEGNATDVNDYLVKEGFNRKFILLFRCIQEYEMMKIIGATEQKWNTYLKKYVKKIMKSLKVKSFDFYDYFYERFGREFEYGMTFWYQPSKNRMIEDIWEIREANSVIRNEEILLNLYDLSNEYKNIVLILGENHYFALAPVLEKTFGHPTRCG